MKKITEVGNNYSLALPELTNIDQAFDTTRYQPGDHFVTYINAEHAGVYNEGIHPLMRGIIAGYHDRQEREAQFSLLESNAEADGQQYPFFIPAIDRLKVNPMGSHRSLMEAIHGYHIRLVDDTNRALETLGGKYRLPVVPMVDPERLARHSNGLE